MIEGKEITLQGEKFTLPPMVLSGLRRMGERFQLIGKAEPDSGDALVDALTLSLKRNYPDMTREFVDASIGIENGSTIVAAFVQVNVLATKGESKGEAQG